MVRRPRIAAALRRRIEDVDGQRCAYCRSPMIVGIPMVVEHSVPVAAGGASTLENLCLSCYRCNECKGARQVAANPHDGSVVSLFHPRRERWAEHFAWESDALTVGGRTPQGRATITLLRLNSDFLLQARRIWMMVGLHPPLD